MLITSARSILTAIASLIPPFGFSPSSRVLQFAAFIWSPSTIEIFATLISGGCLCVPSEEQRTNDPAAFIRDNKIDIGVLTPSFLRSLRYESIESLQTVSLGGEKVPQDIIDQWSSSKNLIHAYGSTETGLAILHKIQRRDEYATVGNAVGCHSWIVDPDDHNRLVGIGEVGELLLQGWNLARGYLNEDVKTKEKFVEAVAWQALLPSQGPPRFVKTGDLARYNPDGSLQIVGRKDAVIKIRGQRVDPADVEHHLRRLLGDNSTVVVDAVTFSEGDGAPKLVAVIDDGKPPDRHGAEGNLLTRDTFTYQFGTAMEKLKTQLEATLPSFMVPAYFIPNTRIPRLPTGKVDRKSIRDTISRFSISDLSALSSGGTNDAKITPGTEEEVLLCAAWLEILRLPADSIGIDDDFFKLGGDSISAMHVVSKLRSQYKRLTVQAIFQSPRLADMAKGISTLFQPNGLTDEQQDLVGGPQAYSEICQEISTLHNLDFRSFEDVYPCTPLQEGMMSMTTARPGAFVVQSLIHLSPLVDLAKFRETWNQVVARQPILRTRIVQTSKGLMQVVLNETSEWLSHADPNAYLAQDSNIPMQCGNKLSRYCIVDDQKESRIMVWTAHHALFDAWSMSMLFQEVERRYSGDSVVRHAGFKSFVKHTSAMDQNASANFWTQYLAGIAPMSFPRVPPLHFPQADSTENFTFPFSKPANCTTTSANLLRGAWALLLSQCAEQDDITFGATVNGRAAPIAGIEHVPGPTIATVPVRIHVPRGQLVAEFLKQVQDDAAAMIPYEQAGLQRIKRLSVDAAQACDFQTLLVIQSEADSYNSRFLDSTVEIKDWNSSSTYALDLNCAIGPDSVTVAASFDSRVLSKTRVHHLLAQFGQGAQQLASSGTRTRVADIDLCTAVDRHLIFGRNSDYPASLHLCMHDLLKLPLRMFSASVAVATSAGDLTYRELDMLSTRLARHLFDRYGIGPDALVPVCFEKTRWAVVAKLAVWKAGGAFVPVDPAYPQAWINHIVHEVDARAVLCSPNQSERFTGSVPALVLDEKLLESLPANGFDFIDPPTGVLPSHPAFVLYTSGTTGTPKGIVHEHRTWASGIPVRAKWLKRNEQTRVVQFSSFSFDSAVEDIWTTLMFGGTVCLPTETERANDLVGFMNRMAVTSAELTPSLAESFGSPATLPTLKDLYVGGEPMTRTLVEAWAQHVRLVNMYGPTEVAQLSHATSAMSLTSDTSNVGHAQACLGWIVDADDYDKLAPVGISGELLIEGPTVARCYLKNEAKTRQGFVENPAWLPVESFGTRRLYKTGDLARFEDDGSTAILGRKDTQVKIRGQRVELVQVEDCIRACLPSARTVVAELITYDKGNPHGNLTAFIEFTERDGEEEDTQAWKMAQLDLLLEKLSASLPQYMVPSAFIPVAAAEHTVTGKADRNKLRERAKSMPRAQIIFASSLKEAIERRMPSTEMERKMCFLWAEVLGADSSAIRADDTFIEHGGDSIFAMKMVAVARHPRHGIDITAEKILRNPKLSKMAAVARHLGNLETLEVAPFALLPHSSKTENAGLLRQVADRCQVPPERVLDVYPCTPLQEGIMALSVKNPGSYVSQHVYSLPPDTDITMFTSAWEAVFDATPTLRTRIVQSDSAILQVVLNEHIQWFRETDLDSYLERDRNVVMDLGTALGRYALVRNEGTARLSFVWTQHHALYDGWSVNLTLRAVEQAYVGGPCVARPAFNSFIKHSLQADPQAQKDYWARQLSRLDGTSFFPRLPSVAYQPEPRQNMEVSLQPPITLPPFATLPILMWTAWALTTARYVDATEVIFGATLSGRSGSLRRVEDIIGPTFTTVPIRIGFAHDETIESLVRRVDGQRTDMMPHEQLGLHHLRKINAETEAACRFQNILVIQGAEEETGPLFASASTQGDLSQFNVYALMVQLTPSEGCISASASFDSAVVSEIQIRRLFRQFEHVLAQLCSRPHDARVGDLEMISPSDQQEILAWNGSVLSEPDCCIHDTVEAWVARQPSAEAVCAWDGSLTYSELVSISRSLAKDLISHGVQPESTVALTFEKSKWAVVAVMAVLEAGGSFVFLDPSHPQDRLRTILNEAGAELMLVSETHASTLAPLAPHAITLSTDYIAALEPANDLARLTHVQPQNKACIVFTSGSTGSPKGIILPHSTICASVAAHGPALAVTPASRVIQFANHVFDMALYEMLTTLMRGGCVCVPSGDERVNDLVGALNRFAVNWAFFTPSTVKLFQPADVPGLQVLVVGGEPVRQEIVDAWTAGSGGVRLFQCSGPAETTLCMLQEMRPHTYRHQLGRAVGGRAWVVDPDDCDVLAPVGTVGELVMEGPVVARGYINQHDIQSGGFFENPAWAREVVSLSCEKDADSSSRRMFRCGDLVRYGDDGALEFVARKDAQVKLRGQRVELNEIQHHLKTALPGDDILVDVVTLQGRSANTLLAFVAPKGSRIGDEAAVDVARFKEIRAATPALKALLAAVLPTFMIPALFVPLTHMPLNGSGKTNRLEIRRIGSDLSADETALLLSPPDCKRPPSTGAERTLQRLWATCLDIDESSIGAEDSFLQIGGDSVLAMRLVALARKEGLRLSVAAIFQTPRLSHMAASTELDNSAGFEDPVAPFSLLPDLSLHELCRDAAMACDVDVGQVQDVYPCTAIQEGLMALSLKRQGAYMAQQTFRIPDSIDTGRLRVAFQKTVNANSILRTRIIQPENGIMLQVVLKNGDDWQSDDNLASYLRKDAALQLKFGASLSRFALIQEGGGVNYIVWTLHHALYDGWCLPRMVQMIERAYFNPESRAAQQITAPEYNRFVRHIASGNQDQDAESFWIQHTRDADPSPFPAPLPNMHITRPDASMERTISAPKIPGSSFTTATLLTAAWALVLSGYTDTNDVTFGTTVSGRNISLPGVEDIIGPTLATVPFRVLFDPEATTIHELATSVQGNSISMIPFQQFGLQNIAKLCAGAREACEFQNLLVIQPSATEISSSVMEHLRSDDVATFRTYPLTLICELDDTIVTVRTKYDNSLISDKQMKRLLGHYEQAVTHLGTADQNSRIADLNVITAEDEQEIWGWNSSLPTRTDCCVHTLIQEQVNVQPHAPAVHSWDGQLTYAELDQAASTLADHLIATGVHPRSVVALCFEKSKWTQVALLGVLKAGAAFLLLDPQHPQLRLKNLVESVQASTIVCSAATQTLAAVLTGHVIALNSTSLSSMQRTDTWRQVQHDPSALAYLISTSGSTGKPKISAIQHSAYSSGATGHIPQINISSRSRVFQFASYAFDTCIEDLLTTLIAGGCICVPSEADRLSNMAGAINSLNANWAHLTPSVASLLDPAAIPGLEVLALGGEALPPALVERWSGALKLVNVYGPSECCVTCSVRPDVDTALPASTIGRPVGCVAWVTERGNHRRLAPVGTVGELLIEGPILAREYVGETETTAAAFIGMPAWITNFEDTRGREKSRVYVTGDLVRYDDEGRLVYVGRKDTQVKLRGQRIELGEVEQQVSRVLERVATVDVAVEVVNVGSSSGLTAFIGFRLEQEHTCSVYPDQGSLGDMMDRLSYELPLVLPQFMVPSYLIPLTHLPLTWTKKLDRRMLRKIFSEIPEGKLREYQPGTSDENRQPSTAAERILQEAWSQVLNKPCANIGVNTSFISLGGDSITAMQVLAHCRQSGFRISLTDVLLLDTISQLGKRLEHVNEQEGHKDTRVSQELFELSPVQQKHFRLHPDGNNLYQLSFVLSTCTPTTLPALKTALVALITHHSALRHRFCKATPRKWMQFVSPDADSSYHICSSDTRDTAALLLPLQRLISITKGPLLAAALHTPAAPDDQRVLALTFHHLVFDLVSWRIFVADLESLLRGVSPDRVFSNLSASVSFKTWCERAITRTHSGERSAVTSGLPFVVRETPTLFWGVPRTQQYRAARPATESVDVRGVRLEGLIHEASPVDVLISALLLSFGEVFGAGRASPAVYVSSHGRAFGGTELDVTRTLGWFTTFYPVQIELEGMAGGVSETAARVRDVRRRVLDAGNPSPGMETQGLMEVALNYTGMHQRIERADSMFKELPVPEGEVVPDGGVFRRSAIFEVVVRAKDDDVLEVHFSYDVDLKRQNGIKDWIQGFFGQLQALVPR